MKPNSLPNNGYSIAQTKLEIAKLKQQESSIVNQQGNNSSLIPMIRASLQEKIKHLEELENEIKSEPSKLLQTNEDDVKELEDKAYWGDDDALNKLITLCKKNANNEIGARIKAFLKDMAERGDNSQSATLFKEFSKDPTMLMALIKGDSAYGVEASEQLADQLETMSNNTANADNALNATNLPPAILEKVLQNLSKDPDKNIHLIAKFSGTLQGIGLLSDIAESSPTKYSGMQAARVLGKAFASSGDQKIAGAALKGLIAAGCAGNSEAVNVLVNVAKSNVSNNKATQAIDALTQIASTSSQNGSDNTNSALGGIINIAKDNNVSPKIRAYAIDRLGDLINQGADPQMHATTALIDLARTSNSPTVANQARENVFKAAENNPMVLDKAIPLFHDVARGKNAPDNKTRLMAVDFLGKAVQAGTPNSDKAIHLLKDLSRNPNVLVAKRSVDNLKNLGLADNKDNILIKPNNFEDFDKKEAGKLNSKPFVLYS